MKALYIIVPFMIAFGSLVMRQYYLEMKILNKLMFIDSDEYERLFSYVWRRARPVRFGRFIRQASYEDEELQRDIESYRTAQRVGLWMMAVFGAGILITLVVFLILAYRDLH